jgi:hypothetical protein
MAWPSDAKDGTLGNRLSSESEQRGNIYLNHPPTNIVLPPYSTTTDLGRTNESIILPRLDYAADHIRLLDIDLSGEGKHNLRSGVSLRVANPRYTALSYPWGVNNNDRVQVNGHQRDVSSNLVAALKEVINYWNAQTPKRESLSLWVDQLCIDQNDDKEKSHQVSIMSRIYQRAEHVLIYLPVDLPCCRARESDHRISRDRQGKIRWHPALSSGPTGSNTSNDQYTSYPRMVYDQATAAGAVDTPEAKSENSVLAWENIYIILHSPWWSRAWVYQEFQLSDRATFLAEGGLRITWTDLLTILDVSTENLNTSYTAIAERLAPLRRDETNQRLLAALESCDDNVEAASSFGERHARQWCPLVDESIWCQLRRDEIEMDSTKAIGVALWVPIVILATVEWIGATAFELLYKTLSFFWCFRYNSSQQRSQARAIEPHVTRLAQLRTAIPKISYRAEFMLRSKTSNNTGQFSSLTTVLRHARSCQCTDPRDKIYAFLGVVDPLYEIKIDYSSTNTILELHIHTTAAIIRHDGRLDVLIYAVEHADEVSYNNRPTWVPDWSRLPNGENSQFWDEVNALGFHRQERELREGEERVNVRFLDHDHLKERILEVKGVRVCKLETLLPHQSTCSRRFVGQTVHGRVTVYTLPHARADDEVWVLLGSEQPFLLRKNAHEVSFYNLLSLAMIQGSDGLPSEIHQGAAVEWANDGELEFQLISIM